MGIFRRSISSSSSRSRTSTTDSTSDTATPRSSLESNRDNDISNSLATIKKAPTAPLLSLPVELIQQITSNLDNASAASFCLSSRFICYAVGTNHLSKHIAASKSRFEKRRTIEAVVERAFSGHWFCAWCDKFHPWSTNDGPRTVEKETRRRDCAEFNSYLHDGANYVLYYHHVRLAINRYLWGPDHGIPLDALSYTRSSMTKIFKTPVPTKLQCEARIVDTHFLLHSSWAVILPSWCTSNKNLLRHIWPSLPHILAGHRDSENGHTGLMAAIDNVVRRGWKYPSTQMCSTCTTDWTVTCHQFAHATGGQVRLVVQTWRDLGSGRNPFETGWRAHGVPTQGHASSATELVRLTQMRAGDVRRAFESAGGEGVSDIVGDSSAARARSASRSRIYRSFMRKDSIEHGESEVRRSRARPRTWRTRSENEDMQRQEEEGRLEESRNVAEEAVRLDIAPSGLLGHSPMMSS
ncbi:Nn.00g114990.m01.CDS01 [Neocucurbitaria sp. VM-36]